jgi:PAS domain S-box-containing protein
MMSMDMPPTPDDGPRLKAVHRYDILDTEPEQAFDDITQMASHVCGTPMAGIGLLDDNRQWFKSTVGMTEDDRARAVALCAQRILQAELFVVTDALAGERFAARSPETGTSGIRFYAGVPLITPDGYAIGMLCVADRAPRDLPARQGAMLQALGRQVVALLELRRSLSELRHTVAERQRTDESLRLLGSAVDQSSESITITGAMLQKPGPEIVFVNPAFTRMTGYSAEEAIGQTPRILQGPRSDTAMWSRLRQRLERGEGCEAESVNYRKDGTAFIVEAHIAPIRDASGVVTHFVGVQRDISARKLGEEALEERARLAVLEVDVGTALAQGGTLGDVLRLCSESIVRQLDAAFARIWTLDERGQMLELQASAGMYTHLDGAHGRVPVGTLKVGRIAEERLPHLTNRVVGDPQVPEQEWAIREGMVAFAGYPLLVENRVVGVVAMFARHTLTEAALQALGSISNSIAVGIERLRMVEELKWKTAFLEAQVNSAFDGILVVDQKREKSIQNQRFVDFFNIPQHVADETADENQLQWATRAVKDPAQFVEEIRYLDVHPNETIHDELELADGRILDRYSAPVLGKDGKYYGRIWTCRDITTRKRLEAQLIQSQKMETVGTLAAGVAHEFNSILTAIIGQSELLLGDLPAGSPLARNVTEISQAASRAAVLTAQLLAFGRRQVLRPEALDLNRVIASMEGVIRHVTGRGVETQIVPAPDLRVARADAGQIEQVIMNVVINARDAMPNGGRLTLETANVSFDQESVGGYPELKPGDYVMLAITDTGSGMSADARAHVFEPFFSTKGVGRGTGLGLSTCYGILKQSGGHISVYSERARGATFKIYLPQAGQQPTSPTQRPDFSALPRGTETILLVEDDPAMCEMVATLLRRLGYTVIAAGDGVDALSLAQQRGAGHIDLLFTDVVMPHMSGKELADRVCAAYPRTKVLFTSAYTEDAIVYQGVLTKGVAMLSKPFTPSALAHKLRDVLDHVRVQDRPRTP